MHTKPVSQTGGIEGKTFLLPSLPRWPCFLSSIFRSFRPSFISSFNLLSFLLSFLPFFLISSFLPSYVPSIHSSFLPSFLPSFLLFFLLCSFLLSSCATLLSSYLSLRPSVCLSVYVLSPSVRLFVSSKTDRQRTSVAFPATDRRSNSSIRSVCLARRDPKNKWQRPVISANAHWLNPCCSKRSDGHVTAESRVAMETEAPHEFA